MFFRLPVLLSLLTLKFLLFFLLGIYFIYISNAIPKVPHMLPHQLPHPPSPTSWPWRSTVLRQIKFARPMGLTFHWWPTRPSSDTYAARDTSCGEVLVSSYCCSTYRVADPPSYLGNSSSSSIGGPVIHPIADCEHPLLCLLGPSLVWLWCFTRATQMVAHTFSPSMWEAELGRFLWVWGQSGLHSKF
jgi:hypothetical protein